MSSALNLCQYILEYTEKFNNRPAFVLKESGNRRQLTFKEFHDIVLKTSGFFQKNFKPGFKVGLWGENSVEWSAVAFAIWHAGGTLVPLMHIATDLEVKNIINTAKLDAIFISPHLNKSDSFGVPQVFSLTFGATKSGVNGSRKTLGEILAQSDAVEPSASRMSSDQLAVLIFTSGTTGQPKGVMLSHANILSNIRDVIEVLPGKAGDRAVSVLPLSHMFELVGGFTIVHLKGMCISYPESLKPEDVLGEMRAHKATLLAAVPLLFEIMDRTIQERLKQLPSIIQTVFKVAAPVVRAFPFVGKILFRKVHQVFGGHVKFFASGGAKIDPEVIMRFKSLGIDMFQGYGLTETSPIISFTGKDTNRYGSVGKTVRSVKVRIDSPSATGEGEICAAGPNIFMGYYQNPEATNEVIKNGWFHTGDIGRIDEDGYIYITGRKKDMIVTPNGKNVYPEELEEILKTSSLFNEVTVIGLDEGRGESVHAVVVPSPRAPSDPVEMRTALWKEIERLCEPLSDYKRIQGLSISLEELPKTATKKVRKHILKDQIKSGKLKGPGASSNRVQTPLDMSHDKEAWLYNKLVEITKHPEVFVEADLRQDLGMDSLTFMELISRIETQWGVQIHDEELEKIFTVNDILDRMGRTSALSVVSSPAKTKKPFNYKGNNTFFMNALRFLVHALIIRPMMKIVFGFKTSNAQVFNTLDKSFIFTPNHESHLDLLSVLTTMPLSKLNSTYAVAADDYFFNHPLKAFFVRLMFNAIPFERKARVDKGFKVCEQILEDGGNLVIFPEGTRSPNGKLNKFKPGVGRLLASSKYYAVPAFIEGAHEAFPKGAYFPKPGKVSMSVGSPQIFQDVPSNSDGYQVVADRLQVAVEKLRDNKI